MSAHVAPDQLVQRPLYSGRGPRHISFLVESHLTTRNRISGGSRLASPPVHGRITRNVRYQTEVDTPQLISRWRTVVHSGLRC